jgi:hypothetical protein
MSELLFGEFYKKILQHFKTLYVTAQSIPNNTIKILPGGFWKHSDHGGSYNNYSGFTSNVITFPSNNSIWVLVTLNYNSQINLIYSDESLDPALPEIPPNEYPLAGILINSIDTAITNNMIFDLRSLLDLSYINGTTIQKIEVATNNRLISAKHNINFIEGNSIYINISNNTETELLDIIISLSGYVPGNMVVPQTIYDLIEDSGTSNKYAKSSHNHGTITNPFIAHEQQYDHTLLHSNINDPTSDQKQALIGSDGSSSTSNRYVTEEDGHLLWTVKNFTSLHNISTFKVITNQLTLADNNTITKDVILGISLNSADTNQQLIVQLNGVITNPSWNWDITKPIYLSSNGNLTQTISSKIQRIAVPLTTTSLYINILDYDEVEITTTIAPTTTIPVTTIPVTTIPVTTVPVTTTTIPVTTVPVTTTTIPVTTVPVTTVPVTTTTVPVTTVPVTTTTVPITTTTIPVTTVPVTTTTVPVTTVPVTTTTVPVTTVPVTTTTTTSVIVVSGKYLYTSGSFPVPDQTIEQIIGGTWNYQSATILQGYIDNFGFSPSEYSDSQSCYVVTGGNWIWNKATVSNRVGRTSVPCSVFFYDTGYSGDTGRMGYYWILEDLIYYGV